MTTTGPLRFEEAPVIQSVCAYGSETLVPNNDICRLSYYLKCCVVGCGINIGIDESLLDYMNAHHQSTEQQEQILRYAFTELSLVTLMDRAFILDDQHILLPQGTLNTFFEFKTVLTYFSLHHTLAAGHHVQVRKVMLCTVKWMREYYIEPFVRYKQGNPIVEIYATPVSEDDELSYAVGGNDYTRQGMVVTPILDRRSEASLKLLRRTCCSCLETIVLTVAPSYRCTQCAVAEFCEGCYNAGRHDQTHVFERICRTSAESLRVMVETLDGGDASFVHDVPTAIAIPVELLPRPGKTINETRGPESVARRARIDDEVSSKAKRGRSSSMSLLGESSGSESRSKRSRKPSSKRRRHTERPKVFVE